MRCGAYIHIPFCASKCLYCDFPSRAVSGLPDGVYTDYVRALTAEIKETALLHQRADIVLDSIFIGGGTPSILPSSFIVCILDSLRSCFRVSQDCEISIEANPGTVDTASLLEYRRAGINRLSFGLQSTDNMLLKCLGRIHTYDDFLASYKSARSVGFYNVNIDMMFGLPNQSVESWEEGLRKVVSLAPEHISAYSLIVEPDTPLYSQLASSSKDYKQPDECTDRRMYSTAKRILADNGYQHYEISNFARDGKCCRHNIIYWDCKQYLGFGAAAHSYINNIRYSNVQSIEKYISCHADIKAIRDEYTPLEESDCLSEFMFMGMRKIKGICEQDFLARFGKTVDEVYGAVLTKLENQELIVRENGYIRLTEIGIDVSNQVFVEFT